MVLSAYDCEILKALFKWIPSSKRYVCVCVCVEPLVNLLLVLSISVIIIFNSRYVLM